MEFCSANQFYMDFILGTNLPRNFGPTTTKNLDGSLYDDTYSPESENDLGNYEGEYSFFKHITRITQIKRNGQLL